ncbi:Transcription factor sfp1 [Umbelopsis sp. WA50703]
MPSTTIEYSTLRRLSMLNIPKQEIDFDAYNFSTELRRGSLAELPFESRELEASFCKNFSCCGLVLQDLHDLLQHYEESHVRFEEDENTSFDEDEDTWSYDSSNDATFSAPNSPQVLSRQLSSQTYQINALKRKAAATMDDFDLYPEEEEAIEDNETAAFDTSVLRSISGSPNVPATTTPSEISTPRASPEPVSKKQKTSPAMDMLLAQSAKKLASLPPSTVAAVAAAASSNGGAASLASFSDLPLTPSLSDEDFFAQAGALFAITAAASGPNQNADKPYKCPVPGCDKAYKNPNGLKYHNQHGHCNLVSSEDGDRFSSKPYQCTIGECGKRYKNLNGLKYHIEHSHMAALNNTLAMMAQQSTPASSPVMSNSVAMI